METNKKYVLQKDGKIVGYFETPSEAYDEALTRHMHDGEFYSVSETSMTSLELMEDQITKAYNEGFNFFGVAVRIPGSMNNELIINHIGEYGAKLQYYKETYDENLHHKYVEGLRITHTAVGRTVDSVANKLAEHSAADQRWGLFNIVGLGGN
ncbi:hypothetical protein 278BB001_53 [Bacillus phage 278BB001]|nr:hypothetical protein 010DV004_63 [Bacillus phage 010DV004]QZA69280.1 hypothetical protein 010DV005_63 [Bacillus phage 010DV005]QZA69848.1 hypothetical protein 043JT007_62 [Bacillus phage 043JT007]QZA70204.1 hypothetical protein 278BB001_53 [Bacillus phage 278BB001]